MGNVQHWRQPTPESPEALEPDENQHRLGASVLHTRQIARDGEWASAIVYGANKHVGTGEVSPGFEHSLLLGTNVQFDKRNSVFGRAEWVQKSAQELVVPAADPETIFDLAAVALGYLRELAQYGGASLGLGARGSINFVPEDLRSTYGTRTPLGVAVYARLRPALLQRAHAGKDHGGHPEPMHMGGSHHD